LDIDIAMLPAGDLTEVGDSGMLLSGECHGCTINEAAFREY
jgi:hypothetical protein